ncbi:CHAT domain-containing tetratricopeptide repeat protein [Imperialibacter roseus]|uniref:CHAT domain-containing tetratricopeptide repeat protein n=1 Tax=Imperialibacter roseus TaxID=1324217 RepID=A0ABZ0ISR1_9BACT|nr:CHAT domain-containing tetratricopeptide repeat protein [Imperialibacter roseus]WOK07000.1 CHAT domain-containing tetratricopeptide repeat protein [Imperialibacter roseus]
MKNSFKHLLSLIVFLILAGPNGDVFAQNWPKLFKKANDSYAVGDYPKAKKSAGKIVKKTTKKLGAENKYLASALVLEAQIDWAAGLHKDMADKISRGVAMSAKVNGETSVDHGLLLYEAAHVWADYGHFVNAQDLLTKARAVLEASGASNDEMKIKLALLQTRILKGKGFYADVVKYINGNLASTQTAYQSAAGKELIASLKGAYGELLMHKADAFRLMGDYIRSDSAFIFTQQWIGKELGKNPLIYSQTLYLNAKLLEENGIDPSALPALYEDALKNTMRIHSASHIARLDMMESLIRSYWRIDNYSKTSNNTNQFRAILNKSFDKESLNRARLETLPMDINAPSTKVFGQEKDAASKAYGNLYPEIHPERRRILEFAYRAAQLNNNAENAEKYLLDILKIEKDMLGADAPEYHLSRVMQANYLVEYSDKFAEAKKIYDESFHGVIEKEFSQGHVEYVNILNHLAQFYEENDDFSNASKTLDKALNVSRVKYDNKDVNYGVELDKIASLQMNIGEYEKAEKNIQEATNILAKPSSLEETLHYTNLLTTKARLMVIQGLYDEAEGLLFESERIKIKSGLNRLGSAGQNTEDLAELYYHLGRYSDATDLVDKYLKNTEKQFGATSRHLLRPLVLKAQLKLAAGEYTDAESFARRSLNIATAVFPASSSKLASSLITLSRLYTTIGDYEKAEQFISQAIANQEKQFGRGHVDVGRSLAQLGMIKFYDGASFKQQQDLLVEAEKIVGTKLGSKNPLYAEVLKDLATVSIYAGEYDISLQYLEEAWTIWKDRIGKRNNVNAAVVNTLKGDIQYQKRQYDRADNFYQDALKTYAKFFSTSHPEYVKVLSKLAKTYYMNGDIRKAQNTIEETLGNYQEFIKTYFPALSEREKAKFWNTIKSDYEFYNTLALTRIDKKEDLIGDIYNNALLTKALLLNTSIKIRTRILSSGDSTLINMYSSWIAKKAQLTNALSMSNDQLLENNVNPAQLVQEMEALEKQLSLKSEVFDEGVDNKVITWQDVKAVLGENEKGVEIVRFRYFDHDFTDSVMYAVIYVDNEKRSKPKLVLLRNGAALEGRYMKLYRNSIKFKIEDEYSYDQFWKPIVEAVGQTSTIYLSADGVYNQINLEAIPTGDGKYVLDNSNIILVSNTRDLVNRSKKKKAQAPAENLALMFGDPIYYVKSEGATAGNENLAKSIGMSEVQRLPGTHEEVVELKKLLNDNGWKTQDYLELKAGEDQVKSMKSPKVFHIATHGFFQPAIEENNIFAGLNESKAYDNPLLRSGLLMAGAGDILNESAYNYNSQSGILTAYEAMNLNLDQTDLVVLSACETGLGEMEAGEGVYGLQRAFLVAGAKTIIMSLFKVSDEATQQLMVKFYQKWITTGDKRRAFIDAKKEIRNEYRDPIYWGPFVMIGLD